MPGFVLLYMVIILASIFAALALAAGQSGAFAGGRLRAAENGADMRMLAMDCTERVLMQMRNAPGTNGTGTIAIDTGSCTYVISGTVPTKTVTITATLGTLYKRITVTTIQINPTITASWVESI